ncbi:acyl-CoA N-acyltransferase [Athelia psychrophila]|uniref:Acyl-CoA N-acyltransferase n=1 Tax=Athelia psychrophila TaxID=1759441 RepID=A0A166MDX3_9AGAM|nr:acyl-CoA N-acyltransferase [Fibularhizoctonia sp. CBS 109695]
MVLLEQEIPYDQNFVFPLQDLANERVRLTPFVPAKHAAAFFDATVAHPELYAHNAFGPYASATQLVDDFLEGPNVCAIRTTVLFAVFAKSSSPTSDTEQLAGLLGYLNASPEHRAVEIGFIMTVPAFQRTHVTSNAVGLLMQYAFGPLALYRVQWQCSTANAASVNAAKRLGFQWEGVKRWDRVYPTGKLGNGLTVGEGRGEGVGRDTAVLSVCWDDWDNGARGKLQAVMDRTK